MVIRKGIVWRDSCNATVYLIMLILGYGRPFKYNYESS
jgi:hypothetical protein